MFTQACFIKNYKRDLISKIENIGYRNYGNPFQFTDFSIIMTEMIKWHFDIAGLIEKGQAVDVNMLKVNPYKKK